MLRAKHPEVLVIRAKLLHSRGLSPTDISSALADEGHKVTAVTVRKWVTGASRNGKPRTVRHTTLLEMAHMAGISKLCLTKRLQRGWSLEKALTTPSVERRKIKAAMRLGLRQKTVYSRLHRGWALERALTEPARRVG